MIRHRMSVIDRCQTDPQFKALVDMLTAWLLEHSDFTPTELREAAMCAAEQVEYLTVRRMGKIIFRPDGTLDI